MTSLADTDRKKLEAMGEYVVRANIGWFALFPKTLEKRELVARARGRNGINLVVYRTTSADRRDHHVIPMDHAKSLLSEETLSNSVTGEKRWNMVLAQDSDRLKVTHGNHNLDVSRFRGIRLLTEAALAFDPAAPIEEGAELDARVAELQALPELARPVGTSFPRRLLPPANYSPFARRPDVKAWVLRQARGQCELCTRAAPFQGDSGQAYLEHHHVVQLAHGGPDTVENSVALCPNCHRWLHLGADRNDQTERLYSQVTRLKRDIPIAGAGQPIIAPDQ